LGSRSPKRTARALSACFQPRVPVPRSPRWRVRPSPSMCRRRFDPGEDAPAWIELGGVRVTGAGGYSLEGSGQPVHLGFLHELPGDSITDLHLSWPLIPESLAAITHLSPGLRRLYLAQTALGDDALTLVAQLRGLTYLQTWGNQFTDAGVQQLAALTDLDHLYLEEETLSPPPSALLATCRSLPASASKMCPSPRLKWLT